MKIRMYPQIRKDWPNIDEKKLLEIYRVIWERKKILQRVYFGWFKKISAHIAKGNVLEIGGGVGAFKKYLGDCSDVISTDIIFASWHDCLADAEQLPFKNESFSNIVSIDAFHHIRFPEKMLKEAQRILKKGGKFILIEPYVSAFSGLIRKNFHHEESDLKFSGAQENESMKKEARSADIAAPTEIFFKNPEFLSLHAPMLKLSHKEAHSIVMYPLSGGFNYRALVPLFTCGFLEQIERLLAPLSGFFAFKMLIVLEKV
ncbi:MAG: class I SAM-dependent methyltransferase [Candidatus Omnitrophica bacterium]|nr:class I SAM-dependent methyltransferase [Candidatus Omnitrophota bacterium]